MTRTEAFALALDYLDANAIEGAIVELGVFRGLSLEALSLASLDRRFSRRVVGVDSWQGLPAPSEYDSAQFSRGALQASIEDARRTLRDRRVELVSGWFADVPRFAEPVALVHLDCDLYQSAIDGLALVTSGIVDGAIVCVDDYFCHRGRPDMGVRRAWTAWQAMNGITSTAFARYEWHGAAFVVHRG